VLTRFFSKDAERSIATRLQDLEKSMRASRMQSAVALIVPVIGEEFIPDQAPDDSRRNARRRASPKAAGR
jgi:hypothetical protein